MQAIKISITILLLALAVTLVWVAPTWIVTDAGNLPSSQLITLQLEYRKALAQILTVVVVLFGLFILYRRISTIEKNIQARTDVQIGNRFSHAVEQLGTYKLEVQLGGIFTLEKIARESEKDHWIIMEILTAYVRENARLTKDSENPHDYMPNGREVAKLRRLPTNIQTILSVIGRRNWLESEIQHGQFLNLRKTNLKYADLRNATLIGANFRGANLSRSNLSGANLAGAFLAEANMKGANLMGCNLQGADLRKASLQGAKLTGANFAGANFEAVNIKGADLSTALIKADGSNHFHMNVTYDEETVFPSWLDQKKRDELGMILELR
ncbi:MAG: pentapeptide repeat-containing protein [bacterium]